jgi:Domain of unknown function (DUF4124)
MADIYSWVDPSGTLNYSDVAPEGVAATRVVQDAPHTMTRAESAAAREASAQQAEMRALAERVRELERDAELSNRQVVQPLPQYVAMLNPNTLRRRLHPIRMAAILPISIAIRSLVRACLRRAWSCSRPIISVTDSRTSEVRNRHFPSLPSLGCEPFTRGRVFPHSTLRRGTGRVRPAVRGRTALVIKRGI